MTFNLIERALRYSRDQGKFSYYRACYLVCQAKFSYIKQLDYKLGIMKSKLGYLHFLWQIRCTLFVLSFARVMKKSVSLDTFSSLCFSGVLCGIVVLVQRPSPSLGLDWYYSCASFPNLEFTWSCSLIFSRLSLSSLLSVSCSSLRLG